jgi:hypothetical protein
MRALTQVSPELDSAQVVTFYLLPTAALLALVATFRLRIGTRVNIALLLVASMAGTLAAETVLLLATGQTDIRPLIPTGDAEPARSLHEVVLALRADGEAAVPRVTGGLLVESGVRFPKDSAWLHPIAPAPGGTTVVLCNEAARPVVYLADRFGFNNADALWDLDEVDLVLIGDSYTHGICVQPEDQIAAVLGTRWRTLNLGATNSGPLRELAILREYGRLKEPPIVAWVYYEGNDLPELEEEKRAPWLLDYLDPRHSQALALNRESVDRRYGLWLDSIIGLGPQDAPEPRLTELLARAPRLWTIRALLRFGVLFPNKHSSLGSLPQILERAKWDVEGWGGRMIVVYIPAYARYAVWAGEGQRGREELLRLVEDLGLPIVDLDPGFRETGDPRDLWTHPQGHLTPAGYRTAAEAMARAIDSLQAEH